MTEAVRELGVRRSEVGSGTLDDGGPGVLGRGSARAWTQLVLSIPCHSLAVSLPVSPALIKYHSSACYVSNIQKDKIGSRLLLSPCLVSIRVQPLPPTPCFALWAHCSETLSAFATDSPFPALKDHVVAASHPCGPIDVARGPINVAQGKAKRGEKRSGAPLRPESLPCPVPSNSLSFSIPHDPAPFFARAIISHPTLPPNPRPFLGPSPEMPCSVWYTSLSLWGDICQPAQW